MKLARAIADALRAAWSWGVDAEGSTRPVALLRIATVLLIWTKWGAVGALFVHFPDPEQLAMGAVFYVVTGLMLVGFHARLSTFLTAVLIGYGYHVLGLEGGDRSWVHHHTSLLKHVTWLLVLTPCGRSLSVDRLLAVRRARREGTPPPPERAPLWGQRLIALQAASVYFWATMAKLTWGFVSGARMEAIFAEYYFGADIPDALWLHALAAAISITTVLLEATLSLAVLWPRIQWWALPCGAFMHLMFYMLLPVSTYSATMIAIYVVVLPPERVHRVLDDLFGLPADVAGDVPQG
jgi:hypothetical protein